MEAAEILELVPIEEYVAQYVDEFEERGGELWCISPFHPQERTPSFSIRPEHRVFFDFSAGIGGNLVDFVMKYDGVNVATAIQTIKKFGHIVERADGSGTYSRLEATLIARKYRRREGKPLAKSTAKPLPPNYMSRFEFRKDKLQMWADEGITWETMKKFDVRYDPLDDRIVYPIRDMDGNLISVCGRTCKENYKELGLRKYTYFQQVGTIATLYGFSDNLQDILNKKELILFEGAKSVLMAHGWGINNTAAVLTSHLNQNQCNYLIRFGNLNGVRILFALDAEVDIFKDDKIRQLRNYTRVEWIKNRDNLLGDKDSPVDKGKEVFLTLYERRQLL